MSGFSKMTVTATATTRQAVNWGIQGKYWARAAPMAKLLKIAGKMVPPRHPSEKPTFVMISFKNAKLIR